jgi:antitoxin component of MazEF toxin-antitoxin module
MIYKRQITGIGGSTGVTFPKDLLDFLGLEKGDYFDIEDCENKDGDRYIILRKAQK